MLRFLRVNAEIAQLAERRYRKPQVVGSTPTLGSIQMAKYNRKYSSLEERKNTKSAVFYVALTLISFVAIYFVGIPLAGRLTTFLISLKGNDKKITSSDITPPPTPKFRDFPEATNQQTITLLGNTEAGSTVKLTFNGDVQETLANNDGQFSFNVTLQDGNNVFAATATDQNGNQSQKTDDLQIIFDKKSPDLTITSPNDGTNYFGSNQRQVTIQGKTDVESSVTINDRIIFVDDTGGFQYTTTLNDGSNSFKIKSVDKAGNITEKDITLNFTS